MEQLVGVESRLATGGNSGVDAPRTASREQPGCVQTGELDAATSRSAGCLSAPASRSQVLAAEDAALCALSPSHQAQREPFFLDICQIGVLLYEQAIS